MKSFIKNMNPAGGFALREGERSRAGGRVTCRGALLGVVGLEEDEVGAVEGVRRAVLDRVAADLDLRGRGDRDLAVLARPALRRLERAPQL